MSKKPVVSFDAEEMNPEHFSIESCNVVWESPSLDSSGSMPLGNGDVGLNLWAEQPGDICFYLSKTDAWSEIGRLLKLGKIRLRFSPNPFQEKFRQKLQLREGCVVVSGVNGFEARIWVDINQPVVRLEFRSDVPLAVEATLELWRNERYLLTEKDWSSAYGHENVRPCYEDPDRVLQDGKKRLVWFHRNEESIFQENLEKQDLAELVDVHPDPLLHLTFGGMLFSSDLNVVSERRMQTQSPLRKGLVSLHVLTAQTGSADDWQDSLGRLAGANDSILLEDAWRAHCAWWADFWDRSWIYVRGPRPVGCAEAESKDGNEIYSVMRGYALQRFINACGGRGKYPIKFNGSIFTVDTPLSKEFGNFTTPCNGENGATPDYRRWGGGYWFQNTRLPYWACLMSGDLDLMEPFFRFYSGLLPMAKDRTGVWFGHDGAFFPETITPWGTFHVENYGTDRESKGLLPGVPDNRWIMYHYTGMIEMIMMMLDYWDHARDDEFFRRILIPWADACFIFYLEHYPRDDKGRLRIAPSQACETFLDTTNPVTDVCGLQTVLGRLMETQDGLLPEEQKSRWNKLFEILPPLPLGQEGDIKFLLPGESFGKKNNIETPELYPVFPFRRYAVGKPDIELAQNTYDRRLEKRNGGWSQDSINAALLGRKDEAARMVYENFALNRHKESRFPAFWGPCYDWVPDQDQGGVAMTALQHMLMQCADNRILLFPAWPREWDVDFKLHAPQGVTVRAVLKAGSLEMLKVHPPEAAAVISNLMKSETQYQTT